MQLKSFNDLKFLYSFESQNINRNINEAYVRGFSLTANLSKEL